MHQRNRLRTLLGLLAATLLLGAVGARAQSGGDPGPGERIAVDSLEILQPSGSSSIYVDSVYLDGEMIHLTVRIADELRRDTARLRAVLDSIENTQAARLMANLSFDPSEWQPTAADRAAREEMIAMAQDREWIYPQGITRIPVFSAPVGAIARALGLVEDVTPRISYTLTATRTITVIVYTISALEVARIVDGAQKPGSYSFDWDMADANGRRVLSGSYFVEVIADGTELLLRKRVEVP